MDEPYSEDYTEHVPQPEDESAPCSSLCSTAMEFTLLRFNPRRYQRGVEAAYVRCVSEEVDVDLWMSQKDIKNNIKDHGEHPELLRALRCYSMPHVEIR